MSDAITATLEPGRELDAIVAEHVMGMRLVRVNRELRFIDPGDPVQTLVVPYYSGDMFAAWCVVERLKKDGWYARLTYTYDGYRCEFSRGDERFGALATVEPKVCRMPFAVCLAAMRVVDARRTQAVA